MTCMQISNLAKPCYALWFAYFNDNGRKTYEGKRCRDVFLSFGERYSTKKQLMVKSDTKNFEY